MKKKLEDYVLTAQSALPIKLCNDTIKEINKNKKNWSTHKWHNRKNEEVASLSGNKELDNLYMRSNNSQEIMRLLWHVIHGYTKHLDFPWFQEWTGYTEVRFNIYKKNKQMSDHCDHIASIFDGQRKGVPILSCVGALNDNFEGGEFMMFDDMTFKLKQGDVLVFPSNFLYPHRVNPVKKGARYSFISWVW
tara:strand:+ start:5852 stop:6424 length:573 start_codon:yes stop_codon:yes gene_type:complete